MADTSRPVASGTFGIATVCRGQCIRILRYPAHKRQETHAHESASITLVIRGALEEESAFGSIRAGVGDCFIKPPGVQHANRFGDVETVTLQIQLLIETASARTGSNQSLLSYRCGPDTQLAPLMFRMLSVILMQKDASQTPALDDLTIDALAVAHISSRRTSTTRPSWLARVETEIRRSLPDVTRVAALAETVGVHPVHMARVFQRIHGCGVVEFVRRLRVQYAATALTHHQKSLCDVALAAGFYDQPHLNRAFRRQLGLSPAHYRRLADVETRLPTPRIPSSGA